MKNGVRRFSNEASANENIKLNCKIHHCKENFTENDCVQKVSLRFILFKKLTKSCENDALFLPHIVKIVKAHPSHRNENI